jgi:hypothetical protein
MLPTWEAEIRRIIFQGQPRQTARKHEALSSKPSTTKKKKKKKELENMLNDRNKIWKTTYCK